MQKLGLLAAKRSQKIFFYPDDVKQITSHNIEVIIPKNYGIHHNIQDQIWAESGATTVENNLDVISNSDVVCKIDHYSNEEAKLLNKKIAISCNSFSTDVKMLENMIKNNVVGLEWINLLDGSQHQLFQQLEMIKCRVVDSQYLHDDFMQDKQNILIINSEKIWEKNIYSRCKLWKNKTISFISIDSVNSDSHEEMINGNKIKHIVFSYEELIKQFTASDLIIYAAKSPCEFNLKFIPKQVAANLTKKIYFINTNGLNGFCTNFCKKFSKNTVFAHYKNLFYNIPYDLTELDFVESSKCLSNLSCRSIIEICQDKEAINNKYRYMVACQDQHIVNPLIKHQLQL